MEVITFGEEYHRGNGLFSVCYTRGYIIPVSLVSDDVNFGDLVYSVSARFPHCKITVSLFIVNKYWGEILGGYVNILFLLNFCPLFSGKF